MTDIRIPSAWMTARIKDVLPRVVTKREIIKQVPDHWRTQYPDRERPEVDDALDALDLDTCDEAAVDAVIGNESWTRLDCDVCGEDRDAVVRVIREYEDPIDVCGVCAAAVTEMLAGHSA